MACEPATIFGPFDHTLFLGCSIMSFFASVGWNEQVGELTVQLVQDTCRTSPSSPKKYWDGNLNQQTTTSDDPGFLGLTENIIGIPAYFRVGEFEFAGLVQSWEETASTSGNPTYTVKLVDPRQILEGAQVIIGEYAGTVGTAYNTINAFGFMESFGVACPQLSLSADDLPITNYVPGNLAPDGATFGTLAGGFGGADANNNGMQWSRIITGLNILINSVPRTVNQWSPYGRLIFKGWNDSGSANYGLLGYDFAEVLGPFGGHSGFLSGYFIDLSELPTPPTYWRVAGTSVSVMDLINQICEDAGCDYYIELIPIKSGLSPSGIAKFIKVRTVVRSTQPALGEIDTFIGATAEGVIDSSKGRELRNEVTTAFIIGGPKQTVYQIEQSDDPEGDGQPDPKEADDIIIPYFGLDDDNNVIVPIQDDDDNWEFEAPNGVLNLELQVITAFDATITINELELQAALGGYDSWLTWAIETSTDTGTQITDNDKESIFDRGSILERLDGGAPVDDFAGRDLTKTNSNKINQGNAGDDKLLLEDTHAIFQFVEKYAREFYGQKFQVRVPYTCARVDGESGQIITSEEPVEGAWTEQVTIIGLPNPSGFIDFFSMENGQVSSFVRFDNSSSLIDKDLSGVNKDQYVISGNNIYMRASIEEEFVYLNKSTRFSPRVVIQVASPLKQKEEDDGPQRIRLFLKLIDKNDAIADKSGTKTDAKDVLKNLGTKVGYGPMSYPFIMPDAASFGIKSNIMTYGPWVAEGPAGQVRVEADDGLVPWEYGSLGTLNSAGISKANAGITLMQIGEMGSVTVPGYPDIPLGAELGAVAGGFFGGGAKLVETRSILTDTINETHAVSGPFTVNFGLFSYSSTWSGLHGPNITNINVSVGSQGVQTSYQMRTYTPKFGRFTKGNAERLKTMGSNRLKANKALRAFLLHREKEGFSRNRRLFNQKPLIDRNDGQDGILSKQATPHEVLVGQLNTYREDFKRPLLETISMLEVTSEFEEYSEKAFMGLEGLLRPVSMDGDGGLPQYGIPNSPQHCYVTKSADAQPPVFDDGSNLVYDLDLSQNFLNPFSNPNGLARSALSARATTYVGHDMDILGRSSTPTGLVMSTVGYDDANKSDYHADYRMLALRGPLLLQSWGYDIDGKPIPNSEDTEGNAAVGNFVSANVTTKFMDQWLRKSHTWPVGPVDLRWDKNRGVWVSPPSNRLLLVTLSGTLNPNSTATAIVTSSPVLYADDGTTIDTPTVTISEQFGNCIPSGNSLLVYYDPQNCKYYNVESPGLKVKGSGCLGTSNTLGQVNAFQLTFGTGIDIIADSSQDCSYIVQTDLQVRDNKSHSFQTISDLFFRNGFTVSGDGCTAIIDTSGSGVGSGIFVQGLGCLGTSTTLPPSIATKLIFSTGVDIESGSSPGEFIIQTDLQVRDHPFANSIQNISDLFFSGGFNISRSGPCTALITLSGTSGVGSGVLVAGTGCLGTSTTLPSSTATKLFFGRGVNIESGGSPGEFLIKTDLSVGGFQNVSEIHFADCFDVSGTGCGVSVSLASGVGGIVNVVTSVFCTGNDIGVTTTGLSFSSCGLFQGTVEI